MAIANQIRKSLPKAFRVAAELNKAGKAGKGGLMVYFGIEGAIRGDSPGLLHKNARLLQYILLYKKDKNLLSQCKIEEVTIHKC